MYTSGFLIKGRYLLNFSKKKLTRSENEANYESVETEEEPPAYDPTQAIFIRDEKRADVSQNELGTLSMEGSKSPNESVIQYRDNLPVYMMFSGFFYIVGFYLSLFDGFNMIAKWNLVRAMVHFTGFTALYLETPMLLREFSVPYAMYVIVNTMRNTIAVFEMLPPSCPGLQCTDKIGFLKFIYSIALMGVMLFEAFQMHMLDLVVKHEEMIDNLKKQSSPKNPE